jgi:hypothetical protein
LHLLSAIGWRKYIPLHSRVIFLLWDTNPDRHRVYASFSVAQKEPTRNNYTDGDPDSYPKAEKLLD